MSQRVSRRTALQWMGGIAAGVILSPAPYALIDDLTIATQTRGRSTPLPRGPLGVVRTRCSACPRACSVAVRTVGGRPYLVIPAQEHAWSCPLRPAVHQLALRADRSGQATIATDGRRRTVEPAEGLAEAASWIAAARDHGAAIGLVDLSGRPPLGTPLSALAAALPRARWIDALPHPLDALGEHLHLDPTLELAVDPVLAERAAYLRPSLALGDGRDLDTIDDPEVLVDRLRAGAASGLLVADDGIGARADRPLLDRLALVNLRLGALGTGRLLPARRRIAPAAPLGQIEKGSLDLLVVDASRTSGAVPWRRLRGTLRPDRGRLVVFTLGDGPAARHGDLVLPAAAPFEVEECVGGDRRGAATRLALSAPIHPTRTGCVDAADLAALILEDGSTVRGADALANDLARLGRGHLQLAPGAIESVASLDAETIAARLRAGAVWEDEPIAWQPDEALGHEYPFESPDQEVSVRLVFDGAPVLASGERVPEILSKIVLEHPLLPRSGHALAHPDLLRRCRAKEAARCRILTTAGTLEVIVHADASVRPRALVVGNGLGAGAFDSNQGSAIGSTTRDPLELLDFDPRADAPLAVLALEVL